MTDPDASLGTRPVPPLPRDRFRMEPLDGSPTPFRLIEALLKTPGRIVYEVASGKKAPQVTTGLAVAASVCLLFYGLIAGLFSGGTQLWAAPVKVLACGWLGGLLCLPSLYIFGSLSGAEISLRSATGLLVAFLAMLSLLLIGFAPVAWVFTVSTHSLTGMGFLHLTFALVSVWMAGGFLVRALRAAAPHTDSGFIGVWFLILILVLLQMPTTLRPILGTADTFLPTEKAFFLEHWGNQFD